MSKLFTQRLEPNELERKGVQIQIQFWNPNLPEKKVMLMALVDTGGDRTLIPRSLAVQLAVQRNNSEPKLQGVSDCEPQIGDYFTIGLTIPALEIVSDAWPVFALKGSQEHCLVGRDLLHHCKLVYNGLSGEVTIECLSVETQ